MKKEIICTVCPMGCLLQVEGNADEVTSISGFTCKRGEEYGKNEFLLPVRILTTTVKTNSLKTPLVAVRTDKPVPKTLQMDIMKEVNKVVLSKPVECYDIILNDVCNTGANIVATANWTAE